MQETEGKMNAELLKTKIKESGKSVGAVASDINVDESTFYRKLQKNGETFTVAQAAAIKDALGLSAHEAFDIFYG